MPFLQAKTHETFVKWVDQLKVHRLYRQHILTFGSGSREGALSFSPGHRSPAQPSTLHKLASGLKPLCTCIALLKCSYFTIFLFYTELPLTPPEREARDGSLPRGVKLCSSPPSNVLLPGTGSTGRLSNWIVDTQSTLESLNRELAQAGQTVTQLNRILEQIESIPTLDVEVHEVQLDIWKSLDHVSSNLLFNFLHSLFL